MSAPRQLWSDLAGERSHCPVTRHEDVNAVRVTSYAGVKEVLRDFRSFSNRFGTVDPGQELPVEDQILAFADPPRHSRQRKLLTAALSASRVERLHEAMQQTVDGFIDAIIATGSPDFELISSLASPFPALMTAELMGVPHELRERFVHYSHLSELSTAMPGVYDADLAQWSELIEDQVRQRRAAGHPEIYERPDEFVVGRDWRKLPPHMGFGYGIHHCIRANLARLEATIALTSLYKRLPGLRVQPGFTPEAVPGWTFRGWMGMMLRYETKEQP